MYLIIIFIIRKIYNLNCISFKTYEYNISNSFNANTYCFDSITYNISDYNYLNNNNHAKCLLISV